METQLASLYGFALILFRAAGLCLAGPLISAKMVPVRVRMAFAMAMAFAAYMGAGSPQATIPDSLWGLCSAAVAETALGIVGGFCASVMLEAGAAATQTAGLGMGLGFGAVLDPLSGADSTALGQMVSMMTAGIAIAAGLHREAFAYLAASVQNIPPGADIAFEPLFQRAVAQGLYSIALTARLCFPLLMAAMFGHLVLGILGRAAPQLSLQSIGFSVAILAGGGAIFMLAPYAAQLAAGAAMQAFHHP
jgi:flagellar biosynthetic protein FliR